MRAQPIKITFFSHWNVRKTATHLISEKFSTDHLRICTVLSFGLDIQVFCSAMHPAEIISQLVFFCITL